jgi:hypothetical protein
MSRMPGVNSLEVFQQAVNEFDITSLRLTIDPAALAAARQSLDQSGLLLLGEVHGVLQNPLLARALMAALEVTGLALEWPAALAPAVSGFLADGRVPDHQQLWGGDGRITVGHFALLRERFLAQRLRALTLFDGVNEAGWSQRESAMAERILHAQAPAGRTLVIAGNAHTALTPTMLGVPLGARLAEWRPGVREIHIRYGNGTYYSHSAQRFNHQFSLRRRARLRAEGGALVLELPAPMQARVPHRVAADQPSVKPSPPGYAGAFTPYRDRAALPPPEPAVQPGYPDFPDYPQQAMPPVPPGAPPTPATPPGRAGGAVGATGAAAPLPRRRGRPNPYETGLTPR